MSIIQSDSNGKFIASIHLRDHEGKTQAFGFVADSRAEACEKLGQWMADNFDERLHPLVTRGVGGLHVCLPAPACPSCS